MRELLRLVGCELLKLRRLAFPKVILALLCLFPIVLAAYASRRDGDFDALFRLVFLYGYLLLLPCALGIVGTLLLSAERDNDTLKNLLSIPVSKGQLLFAKLCVLLVLAVAYVAAMFLATLAGGLAVGALPENVPVYMGSGLMLGMMALLDILPLVAVFLLAHCSKVACVVASLVYAIAGILIVNAFAAGIATSNPVAAFLPRVIEFRWYLGSFAPSGMPASLAARVLPTSVALFALAGGGAAFFVVSFVLYGREEC